tara:strand:- start:1610 stop:1765 length:156 start_codon:yes stop_codon:yes gene_type:complete
MRESLFYGSVSLSNYAIGLTEIHIVLQMIVALLSIVAILKNLIHKKGDKDV